MWLCEGSKVDWTAVAAILALIIWVIDGHRRGRERRAAGRLLAQVMITPLSVAQIDIAKFRCAVVPPGGGTAYLLSVLDSQEGRNDLASKASLLKLDLPLLDKADLFPEAVSHRLAFALSQVSRLRSVSQMLGELPDSVERDEVEKYLKIVLTQIQETEKAIGEAFKALLKTGRSSVRVSRMG